MARPKRVIFEGAIYHVNIRGNNRTYIFNNPKHKSFLLKQIKEYNKVLDFELLAYVIMDNHYHFIIKTNKKPISEVMFYINNVLGKYLTRELNWTGHIFEKRYTCKLVNNDAYLIWLLRYIHRNPVRAGMCSKPDEYRWSSHYFYKRGFNSFVKTDFILGILSPRKATAQMIYLELVDYEGDDANPLSDYDALLLKYKLQDTDLSPGIAGEVENTPMLILNSRKSFEEILLSINIDAESKFLLMSGSRKTSLTKYKLDFIKEALNQKYTLKEIASFLRVSSSSLSMLLSRHKISI